MGVPDPARAAFTVTTSDQEADRDKDGLPRIRVSVPILKTALPFFLTVLLVQPPEFRLLLAFINVLYFKGNSPV